jgi:hypothetical protein
MSASMHLWQHVGLERNAEEGRTVNSMNVYKINYEISY